MRAAIESSPAVNCIGPSKPQPSDVSVRPARVPVAGASVQRSMAGSKSQVCAVYPSRSAPPPKRTMWPSRRRAPWRASRAPRVKSRWRARSTCSRRNRRPRCHRRPPCDLADRPHLRQDHAKTARVIGHGRVGACRGRVGRRHLGPGVTFVVACPRIAKVAGGARATEQDHAIGLRVVCHRAPAAVGRAGLRVHPRPAGRTGTRRACGH